MRYEELKCIAASVPDMRGWDFSLVRLDCDPVPWDYVEVVRRYLKPTDRVLDIGTGGGEVFLSLAPYFGVGVGIDMSNTMLQVAHENTPESLTGTVSYRRMRSEALQFPEASFDIVLNRHATGFAEQVVRVLRPGGLYPVYRATSWRPEQSEHLHSLWLGIERCVLAQRCARQRRRVSR